MIMHTRYGTTRNKLNIMTKMMENIVIVIIEIRI